MIIEIFLGLIVLIFGLYAYGCFIKDRGDRVIGIK